MAKFISKRWYLAPLMNYIIESLKEDEILSYSEIIKVIK